MNEQWGLKYPPESEATKGPIAKPKKRIGDSEGEHYDMPRGRYNAWVYVIFSVFLQILFWVILATEISGENVALRGILIIIGLMVIAFFCWDRWRCIEAFSSNFCCGYAQFSLLYVPVIAFLYTNYRGLMKLFRR